MGVFTEKELIKAKEIITIGLAEAAKSLGTFIKSETQLELGDDFSISENFQENNVSKRGEELYLLTTELKEDLKGVSYLIFSKDEVKSIMESKYPNKEFGEEKYLKKAQSLILETDNIITAGVMSQLANVFNYRTYGGVPQLVIVNHNEANKIIAKGTKNSTFLLGFKAILSSKSACINADLIWSIDEAFIKGVKKITNN